jgi:hypothetical protein
MVFTRLTIFDRCALALTCKDFAMRISLGGLLRYRTLPIEDLMPCHRSDARYWCGSSYTYSFAPIIESDPERFAKTLETLGCVRSASEILRGTSWENGNRRVIEGASAPKWLRLRRCDLCGNLQPQAQMKCPLLVESGDASPWPGTPVTETDAEAEQIGYMDWQQDHLICNGSTDARSNIWRARRDSNLYPGVWRKYFVRRQQLSSRWYGFQICPGCCVENWIRVRCADHLGSGGQCLKVHGNNLISD